MVRTLIAACLVVAIPATFAGEPPGMPLPYHFEESAAYRWLNKPVLDSRLLHGMESLANWSIRSKGEMSLTAERSRDGVHSLRLRVRT